MKYLFIFVVVFTSCFLQARAQQNSIRWKETERRGTDNKPMEYTDTFYLQVGNTKDWMMRRGGFMYKGTVNNRKLEFADRTYNILHKNNTEIQLEDEDHILSVFTTDSKDNSAIDATQIAQQNQLPTNAATNINYEDLNGNWTAYKRSTRDGKPMKNIDFNTLIKSIKIYESTDTLGNKGIAFNSSGMQGEPTFTITKIENSIIYYKDKSGAIHQLTILKLDNKEFIAEGDNGVVYYFKK